ncbi:Hemerythrin HHE cation binding domain-containing protein [Cnuella takakiae]|uniref:Hemerythrin HHE cation binding domain-containing protein n=1 Tax=Cnuella takakiae TaxID=1302690 RepID=A0A1M5B541_9BACT|nr:hemerythrin domain-containing protein [Cnuella takakiae]OLY93340.1 hypothetical protein BUE76_16700 [Cnuella takakiae]SHF37634.1 Hemerythrin HHE cation binding domain-containing protein [Cnuella takakiae]
MPTVVTPIKRSKELAPLSREHHEGLLFVFKIRQGLKMGISKERMGRFCTWSWASHFAAHFQKEEAELIPILGECHPMIEKMLEEHEAIADKFAEMMRKPTLPGLERLAQILNYHIRFEERQLFPLVEQMATKVQLVALGEALADEMPACGGWRDAFWVAPKF